MLRIAFLQPKLIYSSINLNFPFPLSFQTHFVFGLFYSFVSFGCNSTYSIGRFCTCKYNIANNWNGIQNKGDCRYVCQRLCECVTVRVYARNSVWRLRCELNQHPREVSNHRQTNKKTISTPDNGWLQWSGSANWTVETLWDYQGERSEGIMREGTWNSGGRRQCATRWFTGYGMFFSFSSSVLFFIHRQASPNTVYFICWLTVARLVLVSLFAGVRRHSRTILWSQRAV